MNDMTVVEEPSTAEYNFQFNCCSREEETHFSTIPDAKKAALGSKGTIQVKSGGKANYSIQELKNEGMYCCR